ncbi:transglutaminase family protein [Neobacillus niacini]|uniref:transglutaminase-like domain-containing protein n=1 Tax=Neobacillus niacini TaxID=86668 RepID=UPI0030027D6D
MRLMLESTNLKDYLEENEVINFSHPLIKTKIDELFNEKQSEIEKVKTAFHFVRDHISHSWDIQSERVTLTASDVLKYREGICYAKSNLLASLLRAQGIPTGFCYQRLMIFDTPDKGYSLHALNGIYLKSIDKWIRLDARGNKPGVQSEFSTKEEKLAFTINEEFDEKDFSTIYTNPNQNTIKTLKQNSNALEMYKHYLPDAL